MTCTTLNNAALIYTAIMEGTGLSDSSYSLGKLNMIVSSMQLLPLPLIYGFIRKLSKNKSRITRTLQISINLFNSLLFITITLLALVFHNVSIALADVINVVFYVAILSSLICLGHLLIGWVKSASLKREHVQAVMLTTASAVTFAGLLMSFLLPIPLISLFVYGGQLIFLSICNHYAHQYNSFSFNVSNLAGYVYKAVNLPVLILDETSGIVMHNACTEQFFQKSSAELGKLTLFDFFKTKNGFSAIHRSKKDNVTESTNAVGADSLYKSMLIVKDNRFLESAYEMAMYHHEKWNGCGYPNGIEGEDIPFLARVIAIADVYDALRSERPYKAPFSREKAKAIIMEEQGRQFDPVLVEVFLTVEPDFDAFCNESVSTKPTSTRD